MHINALDPEVDCIKIVLTVLNIKKMVATLRKLNYYK